LWWNGGYFGSIFQVKTMLPKAEVCCFPCLHPDKKLDGFLDTAGTTLE
jgi:hypothetical protein